MTPWQWVTSTVEKAHEFFTQGPGHEFTIGAALFLIVGGLAILFLISSLLLLQSVVPSSVALEPFLASAKDDRQLRPLYATPSPKSKQGWFGRRSRKEPEPAPPPLADRALDAVVQRGTGEPRLLRYHDRYALVRMLRCHGCETLPKGGNPNDAEGCRFEADYLADAFATTFAARATVREIGCRRRGQPWCDFEVKLA